MGRDTPPLPLNIHCQRQGGQMLGSMARPARRGHRRHVYEGAGRGPLALRGRTFTGSPRNPGRPGPGFRRTAMPESQASAHPGARDVPTRKRQARSAWPQRRRHTAQPGGGMRQAPTVVGNRKCLPLRRRPGASAVKAKGKIAEANLDKREADPFAFYPIRQSCQRDAPTGRQARSAWQNSAAGIQRTTRTRHAPS